MRIWLSVALSLTVWLSPSAADRTELEEVGRELAAIEPHQEATITLQQGALKLLGYLRHWHFAVGAGRQVILIDQMRGTNSILLIFSPAGRLETRRDLGAEIEMLLLCDLDHDGSPELVLDQLDGWGSGLLQRSVRVIDLADGASELWSGPGASFAKPPGEPRSLGRTFLACEPGRDERPSSHLLVLREVTTGRDTTIKRTALKLDRSRLVEVPWVE